MKLYKSTFAERNIMHTYDQLLSLWNVKTEETDIPTTYGQTHVILCGDAALPPLVLFHGVGDDSALMWLYNAAELSRHFRLYAVDTIGGPGKSRPNDRYNEQFDDGQWIDETLSGLQLDRVYIAGVSNGAYLTQYYGRYRPEKIIRMVCMAGSVPAGDSGSLKTMLKIFLPEALFPTKRNTEKLIKKLSGQNSRAFTDQPVVMEHYRYLLKGFRNAAMRYHRLERFSDGDIAALREKTLFLVGEDDSFAQAGGKAMLLRYRMNARFFPGVGHGINHEAAAEINRAIIDFLSAPAP